MDSTRTNSNGRIGDELYRAIARGLLKSTALSKSLHAEATSGLREEGPQPRPRYDALAQETPSSPRLPALPPRLLGNKEKGTQAEAGPQRSLASSLLQLCWFAGMYVAGRVWGQLHRS
jgi:hypothetical protein